MTDPDLQAELKTIFAGTLLHDMAPEVFDEASGQYVSAVNGDGTPKCADDCRGCAALARVASRLERAENQRRDLLYEYKQAAEYAHDNVHQWKDVPFWDCPLIPCSYYNSSESALSFPESPQGPECDGSRDCPATTHILGCFRSSPESPQGEQG